MCRMCFGIGLKVRWYPHRSNNGSVLFTCIFVVLRWDDFRQHHTFACGIYKRCTINGFIHDEQTIDFEALSQWDLFSFSLYFLVWSMQLIKVLFEGIQFEHLVANTFCEKLQRQKSIWERIMIFRVEAQPLNWSVTHALLYRVRLPFLLLGYFDYFNLLIWIFSTEPLSLYVCNFFAVAFSANYKLFNPIHICLQH